MRKESIIFDNYDLDKTYPTEELIQTAIECGWIDDPEDATDDRLTEWRYQESDIDYECEMDMMKDFFAGKDVIFFGSVGRWDGTHDGGKIGDFESLYQSAITDCAYIKIYDKAGHFYIECSHHDGTNSFEVKELTAKGREYFDNWQYGSWNDKRSERYIHDQIIRRYSKLPRYAKQVFGV